MTYLEKITNTKQSYPGSMVASISSRILEIRKESIKQSLSGINTLEHRQEYIATIEGALYYDDSRAENVNATWFTFENIVKPVIWIAGGNNSKTDFRSLRQVVREKVKVLICIGSEKARLRNVFQKDIHEIYEASSIEEAVKTASLLVEQDDIVLFSPACKSENERESYLERGDLFTATVKRLGNECDQ